MKCSRWLLYLAKVENHPPCKVFSRGIARFSRISYWIVYTFPTDLLLFRFDWFISLRYISYILKFIHVKCLVVFSIFTESCSHYYELILKHFYPPQKKPLPLICHFLFFPSPIPMQPHIFLSLCICLFWIFHINEFVNT